VVARPDGIVSTRPLTIDSLLADPLGPARAAERAVGFVGLDLPEELLAAVGGIAAHLPWQRDSKTPFADRWLEDSFPGWARSILEQWAAGVFDFFPAAVFSRGDDVSQRLYYYVCELQRQGQLRGPEPLVWDVALLPRPTSLEHTAGAVARLAAELGISLAALAAGMPVADGRRARLRAWHEDTRIRGHCRERIARASLFAPLESLAIETHYEPAEPLGRVFLAGSVPPDDGLHRAVEAAGWTVSGESHARDLERLGPPIGPAGSDPARQVAEHILAHRRSPRAWYDRAGRITAAARERQAEAVILWLFEQDEAFAWDVLDVQRALAEASLPTLVMARRRWDLADSPATAIEQFLRELRQ
jgi:hypothetical protein